MIPEKIMRSIFKKTLSATAKKTGFIQRKRDFSAFEFLLLMTMGQMGMVHPSLALDTQPIRVSGGALKYCTSISNF